MRKKVLKYNNLNYTPELTPVKDHMPKWYKESSAYRDGKKSFWPKSLTYKSCVPVLDSMISGYVIPLPADVIFSKDPATPRVSWGTEYPVVTVRPPEVMPNFPVPIGFENMHYAWENQMELQLPKGYSAIVTHPFNRLDLPFQTHTGIVDDYSMGKGALPFLLRDGFEGLIPAGTPIAQVIPFKREPWKAKRDEKITKQALANSVRLNAQFRGWYRDNVWKSKSFE